MQFHSRYAPGPKPVVHFDEPTLTQQHFAEECDVNNILQKFTKTGILPTIGPGVFADVSSSGDYLSALQVIQNADEQFSALPSNIRKEFGNDPSKFLAFVFDENNKDKAIELGLIPKPANITPTIQAKIEPEPVKEVSSPS